MDSTPAPRGRFAFLIHPRTDPTEDLALVNPLLGLLPARLCEAAMRRLPLKPWVQATVTAADQSPEAIAFIVRTYLGRLSNIPPNLMPGLADLTGLPPVRIVLSEYDDLRSSGELFAVQLAEAGVPVEATVAEGMLHGHLNMPPVAEVPEIERSLEFLAAALA